MKRRYLKILRMLLLIAVVVVVIVANVSHRNSVIKDVVVVVDYAGNDTLVSANQLKAEIMNKHRDITTQSVGETNLEDINAVVKSNPYVDETNVSITVSSEILIRVTQRTPLVRIFTSKSQFYLDTKGRYMPISNVNNQRVIIANGYIKKDFSCKPQELDINAMVTKNPKAEKCDIVKIYRLAKFMESDKKTQTLFDQIYMNDNGDLEIVPKLGNHVVLLGNLDNLDVKFENLYALYEKGFSKTGWDKYSYVNLKFNDQIICTKKQQ